MERFEIDQVVICINNKVLEGNDYGPSKLGLILDKEYRILDITEDGEFNQHLDIGLISDYNYIKSYETKENLPNGDIVQWCHPSRFKLKVD